MQQQNVPLNDDIQPYRIRKLVYQGFLLLLLSIAIFFVPVIILTIRSDISSLMICQTYQCEAQANQLRNGIDSKLLPCIDLNKLFDKNNQRNYGSLRSAEDQLDHRLTDILRTINGSDPDFVHEMKDDYAKCIQNNSSGTTCLQKMKKDYSIALLYLYTRKYLTSGNAQLLQKIIDQICNVLIDRVTRGHFEFSRKQRIIGNLKNVELFVGMVDVFNGTHNVDLFTELETNFTKNQTSPDLLNQQMEQFLFSNLDQRYDKNSATNQKYQLSWIINNPFGTVPEYRSDLNRITLPIALIQESFVDEHLPNSLNYGSIGTLIGHELTHSLILPLSGIEYTSILNHLCQCFHQQHQEWKENVPETCLRPSNFVYCTATSDEQVADNIGLSLAYQAFQNDQSMSTVELRLPGGLSHLTPSQLFWIRLAITYRLIPDCSRGDSSEIYPENHFRVLALMLNNANFKKDFPNDCLQLFPHHQTSKFSSSQLKFRQTCSNNYI